MADDTALLDYGFDIAPVVNILICDCLDHPIAWCGRAVNLLKFCSAISSAATDYKNCCDPADSSIDHLAMPLTR